MNSTNPIVLNRDTYGVPAAEINALRAHTIRIGLEFEIRNPNMRLTNKAPKCTTIVKRELGFKGSRIKIYAQYVLWMEEKGLLEITPSDRAHLMALAL
jgi:hypothetical protein